MAEPNGYIGDARVKFSMKRKLEWKLNVSTANKRRIEISEKGNPSSMVVESSNRRSQASG